MNSENYKIRIVNGEQEIELEGSIEFIEDMLKRFEEHIPVKVKSTIESKEKKIEKSKKINEINNKQLSISEFIRKLKFKKHTDIVLSFGYYLEKYSGLSEFSPADINNCYYDAKMESSNTSQMIIYLIKRGHLMEARSKDKKSKAKKIYTLTNTGIQYIETALKNVTD